jgi:hypothetical protein
VRERRLGRRQASFVSGDGLDVRRGDLMLETSKMARKLLPVGWTPQRKEDKTHEGDGGSVHRQGRRIGTGCQILRLETSVAYL